MDVYGTQYQLLAASACFIKSKTMTCSSCHDPHAVERNLKAFSAKCMNCHSEENHNFCKMADKLGATITNNCVDCHMPAKPSKAITLLTNGQESATPDLIRTHLIAIYKNETDQVLGSLEPGKHLAKNVKR